MARESRSARRRRRVADQTWIAREAREADARREREFDAQPGKREAEAARDEFYRLQAEAE